MGLKYIGDGRSAAGIPARDLSDEEAQAIEAEQPGFLAQVDAGDVDDGPTPIYRRMTAAEDTQHAAQVAQATREREDREARKLALRRGDPLPEPAPQAEFVAVDEADDTEEEN